MIAEYVAQKQKEGDTRDAQDIVVEYNDTVIYPDKVRLNCYYYRHYSFVKDIQMLFCTVLGRKMEYAGEVIWGRTRWYLNTDVVFFEHGFALIGRMRNCNW